MASIEDNEFEVDWEKFNNANIDSMTDTERENLDYECNLYDRFCELGHKLDNFCDYCDDPNTEDESDEYWGCPCKRTEYACEVGDDTCNYVDEYYEMIDEYKEIYEALQKLYNGDFGEECKY
jgi:hypothetical protein